MFKTGQLTKTVYNTNPNHSQPIHLFTPSTTSSSGSICETDPSSISSSVRSNHEDFNAIPTDESLIIFIDKLKRELAIVKQAKSQLAALYKVTFDERKPHTFVVSLQVKCKSDLDKSAKITKLRLQFEYELNSFCKQDQKDLVCYLQRQLLVRDQRISELSYDLEQLRNASLQQQQQQQGESVKLEPIQILRFDDPDLVISTVSEV